MVGLFNKRRRPDSYQGFSKYTHEINQYHNSQQHAGLPIQPQAQQAQLNRSQSLTSAGQAAAAALRLHSSPIKNQNSQQQQQKYNQNRQSNTQYNQTAAQRQYGRSNSLSNVNRSNSLRQYTYNPQASYQVGNSNNINQGVKRFNSLNSHSRGSLTRSSQSQQRQLQQQQQAQQQSPQNYIHEDTEDDNYNIQEGNENEEEEEYVVTTTTTKVVDSQGRTQSIITKTVKTFPDGSNIIETATKNISRSNSRSNSLSSANFRNNSMTHQPINLSKIDEDLQNFDYDYQVDDLNDQNNNKLKLNTGEPSHIQAQPKDIIKEEEEEEEIEQGNGNFGNVPKQELGEPFTDDLSKPRPINTPDRTSSITSQGKPLRSILKRQQSNSIDETPTLQQNNPVGVENIPIAAAPQVASNVVNEVTSKSSKHPYQNLTQSTPTQPQPQSQSQSQPVQQKQQISNNSLRSPNQIPQSTRSSGSYSTKPIQPISSPKDNIHYSHSPGSSIKFDDKIETIPILNDKSAYSQQQNYPQQQHYPQQQQQHYQQYQQSSPPTQPQFKSKSKKPTPPGPISSSSQQPSAEFYAAAMQAAYKKVYGDRDPNAVSQQPISPNLANSQQPLTPPQQPQQSPERKSRFGFIPLSPRKDPTPQNYEAPQQQQYPQERTSSIDSSTRVKIQRDQTAAPPTTIPTPIVNQEKSIPSNYEYTNHHREFPLHSMRDEPKISNMRKEKAKEENKIAKEQEKENRHLAKEKAKEQAKEDKRLAKEREAEEKRLAKEKEAEDKRLAKEQADEEKRLAKEAKKRDKKPIFGGIFNKNKRQSQSSQSIYSNESNNIPSAIGRNSQQSQRKNVQQPIGENNGVENGAIQQQQPDSAIVETTAVTTDPTNNVVNETTVVEEVPTNINAINNPKDIRNEEPTHTGTGTTHEPIPESNIPPRPDISEPVKVERLGPALETQADNIVQEIKDEANEYGTVDVEGVPISNEVLNPPVVKEPLNEPEYLNPAGAVNNETREVEDDDIPPRKDLPTEGVVLDDGEYYKISVPRNHSYLEEEEEIYNKSTPKTHEVLPSPNINRSQRNSKFMNDSYEPNNNIEPIVESSKLSKVPKPQLNEIDDELENEPEIEDPSFKSYEKVEKFETPLDNEKPGAIAGEEEEEEIYDVVNEEELKQLQNDPNVRLEEIKPIKFDDSTVNNKTPQVNAVPTFKSNQPETRETDIKEAQHQHQAVPTLDPKSNQQSSKHEVHPSAFVKDSKNVSDPKHVNVGDDIVGSQFVKNKSPQSKQQPQTTANSQIQSQGNKRLTYSSGYQDQDSFVQPSADTLPTTQSKYGNEQQASQLQEESTPIQEQQAYENDVNGDTNGVIVEEKSKNGKSKSKKDKKPNKFKEKLFKYFVSAYDN
ncbi:uncharacterized protein KGF55_004398 [Candida pseudojiufengensis]|uniref:uncharacterized protein n=1 Tax=Candida pseudojiufengensis TaxID=497109 RepID=UPI002225A94A|nr:uncharacterized protein KGF55_004398 [Candida pseudojiufengensis]KAI5960828.1 hypothetical protein KGF55_004398 [Candida pseudojiufengensis]